MTWIQLLLAPILLLAAIGIGVALHADKKSTDHHEVTWTKCVAALEALTKEGEQCRQELVSCYRDLNGGENH